MMDILQSLEPAMAWLLRVSAQSAVLVVLILLVQALGRERIPAGWRHALWLLLVLRLALPVQLPSRFSLFNLAQPRPQAAVPGIMNPQAGQVPTVPQAPAAQGQARVAVTTTALPAIPGATPATVESARENPRQEVSGTALGWKTWLPLLWLMGAAVLVLRIVIQNLLFYRKLRLAPTMTATEAWQTLEASRKLMEVRQRLVLVESEIIHSPALYGFLRLHLLLPANTLANLTGEELRFVLLHELAHVKRRDMLVGWVVTVLQVIYWFNPLVWLGFRQMAAEREMAADALALSRLQPRENVAYGSAILKLLRTLMRPASLPGLVGILEDNNQMKRRITMIAKFKNSSRWPVSAALAFAAIALVAVTDPSSGSDRKPLKLSGKPAADLAVLRVWSSTNGDFSWCKSVTADGRYLSYTDPVTGGLMVRDLIKRKSHVAVKVAQPWKEFATESAISPEGSRIAYGWSQKSDTYQLRVVGRDGKGDRVLYQSAGVNWIGAHGWSADGMQVVADLQMKGGAAASNQLVIVSLRDASVRTLKRFAWDFPAGVCLDPSGRFLAYHIRRTSASPEREVHVINLLTGEDTVLLGGPADNACLGWSPDGYQLLFTSNRRSTVDCWVQPVINGRPQGAPELLKADLGPVTAVGITRAGGLYYSTSSDSSEVRLAKLEPDREEFLSEVETLAGKFQGHEEEPHWSPDGKQLAYLSRGMLRVRNAESSEEREYALKIGDFHNPVWSADGKWIRVVTSHVNERPGTFRVDLATGAVERLEQHGFFVFPGSGQTVGYKRVMDSPQKILRRNILTGEESLLYPLPDGEFFGGGIGWMLSPNAQAMVFGTCRGEGAGWRSFVKMISTAGGEPRVLMSATNGFGGFDWFPDGRRLLVSCQKELFILSTDGQVLRTMKSPVEAHSLSIRPSGGKLAFVQQTTRSELWLMDNAVPPHSKPAIVTQR